MKTKTKKKTKKGLARAPKEPAVKITKIAEGFKVSPIEAVLIGGDLAVLSPEQRFNYYLDVCRSLELNPLTQPFGYISLDGGMKLYAKKDCAEQLRKKNGIGITDMTRTFDPESKILTVEVKGKDKWGKVDIASGSLCLEKEYWKDKQKISYELKGQERANAMMKCETKAKRRLALSMSGLSMPDETEVGDIQGVKILEAEEEKTRKALAKVEALPESKPIEVPRAEVPPQPVEVKSAKEKSMYEVYNGFNPALKSELAAAGYKTPWECYQAYKQVAGDLDALFQLCQERIRRQK